ncbi:TatD family hydrolase [Chondromyces crocatus]|nr:TatD family hydrolase [Chondromyces crocatus]
MSFRTTDDYQAMEAAGVSVVLEPSSWLGQPRMHVGSFEDHFASLLGWERYRASQFGISHLCALALNPREANNGRVAQGVVELLPRYLPKEGVVAVGMVGFEDLSTDEEHYFVRQIELARVNELPLLVHTPLRDKKRATERSLAILREHRFPEEWVLIEDASEETLPLVLATRCWAGCLLGASTGMGEERVASAIRRHGPNRILVSSAADWSASDPLQVPKLADRMRAQGLAEDVVQMLLWGNPIAFFAQSGKLDPVEHGEAALLGQRGGHAGTLVRAPSPQIR